MTAEQTANPPNLQVPPRRNTGLHGAFLTRCLLSVMRFTPQWLALVAVRPIALLVYALASPQRQAVQANIAGLCPEYGPVERWWAGYQVFLEFALTYLDRLWHMHFHQHVAWDVPHKERFDAMRSLPTGVLIFTIHSGNYDIGAGLFAQKFGRTLHTVRAPEQTPELQALREAELRETEAQNPLLRVHYNHGDNHLGLELCRILHTGEAVAVQGDRVLTGVSPVTMQDEGRCFQIPRGPLVLAEIARVPCYPIFLERLSCMHYRIHVGECFYDGRTKKRADDLGKAWLSIMHQHLQQHWQQWFVFEPMVTLENPRS